MASDDIQPGEPKAEITAAVPPHRPLRRLRAPDWRPHAKRMGAAIAALAAFGAILGGLTGYWSAYKTAGEWFGLSRSTAVKSTVEKRARSAPPLSVVVLPFSNLSDDASKDYLADAITEGLTTDLSRIPESFVIARNTAFTYKGKPVDVRSVGQELGVHYVLEGSVQWSGDQVRVNAQLIDTTSGAHVWSDRFDRPQRSYLELQDDVVSRLARSLGVQLVALEARRIELEHLTNPTALDLALQGWAVVYKPTTPATRQEARRLFEQSLTIDGNTFRALIGLSLVLSNIVINGQSTNPAEDLKRAEELSLKGLALDPNRASTHAQRARVLQVQRRQEEAAEEYRIAIQLDPNGTAPAMVFLGETFVFTGRPAEALPLFEQAMSLSPRDTNLGVWQFEIARALLLLKRDAEALDWSRKSVATNSRLAYAQLYLAAALALARNLPEARDALTKAGELNGNYKTLAKFRATDLSDNAAYVEQRKHVEDGLLKAGIANE